MKKLKQAAKKLISAIVALALFISPLSDYLPILGEGMKVSAENYEYAMFPMETLNISQGENGGYSHKGTYALDMTGANGSRENIYAPFTGTIKKIDTRPVKEGCGHGVWLQSDNPVVFADGTIDYMTIKVTHDNDVSDLYVGKK